MDEFGATSLTQFLNTLGATWGYEEEDSRQRYIPL
jgi:hypothetical protein